MKSNLAPTKFAFDQPARAGQPPWLEIVRAAGLAPSPDNNQPWRFRCDARRLFVEHDAGRGLPSDADRMFDLQSLGAAIENACIAGRQFGWAGTVHCLDASAAPAAAQIEFVTGAEPDSLFPLLAERRTSRRGYSRRPPNEETLARLAAEARVAAGGVQIDWIADRPRIRRLAGLIAAGDRLRFEYRTFHAELFRQLRFTPDDVERSRDGLDLRLLALPPGGALALRMLRSWKLTSALNRCGLSKMLTLPSAAAVRRSGVVGVLSVASVSARELIAAGRALERLWLAAAGEKLCVHPLGSLPILLRRLERSAGDGAATAPPADSALDASGASLSAAHRRLSERIQRELRNLAPAVADRTVTMLLRVGYGPQEKIKSLRRAPEELVVQSDCDDAG